MLTKKYVNLKAARKLVGMPAYGDVDGRWQRRVFEGVLEIQNIIGEFIEYESEKDIEALFKRLNDGDFMDCMNVLNGKSDTDRKFQSADGVITMLGIFYKLWALLLVRDDAANWIENALETAEEEKQEAEENEQDDRAEELDEMVDTMNAAHDQYEANWQESCGNWMDAIAHSNVRDFKNCVGDGTLELEPEHLWKVVRSE